MIDDYNVYKFSKKECIQYMILGGVGCLLTASLFYSNLLLSFVLIPFIPFYLKNIKRKLIAQRKWQLNIEFRDGLLCLSAALNASYSLENAFIQAVEDLRLLYRDNSLIVIEFEGIVHQIHMNVTVESIIEDLGRRSGIEDIMYFSEVLKTAKRTGGDLIQVIRTTSKIMSDKLEVKREIVTLITAKKLEANIMIIVPFGIVLYLKLFSPEFLVPLYHNLFGIIFMTIILLCIYGISRIASKIMDIQV